MNGAEVKPVETTGIPMDVCVCVCVCIGRGWDNPVAQWHPVGYAGN